ASLAGLAPSGSVAVDVGSSPAAPVSLPPASRSVLLDTVAQLEAEFAVALAAGDADGAVRAILALDAEIVAWSADTLQSDELDRARATLRSMVVRLGEAATRGLADPRATLGPFVDALLETRARARHDRRWADADA